MVSVPPLAAGLRTQASSVNAVPRSTSALLRTRVAEPSKTMALPKRPAAVHVGLLAVAAVFPDDASATFPKPL